MGDKMKLLHVFSVNIKKYRLMQGLSQEELAEKAGLHRTYISLVEREKRNIALDNVEKMANALGVAPYLLFIDDKQVIDTKAESGWEGIK